MLRFFFAVLSLVTMAAPALAADTFVPGYVRKDGTYVQPHYRSAPDSSPYNNWSTQPNVNPHTGQPGTRTPESFTPAYPNPNLAPPPFQQPPRRY